MNAGIYVHIPFCHSKCNYCNFVSRTLDEGLADRYWRAVVREIAGYASAEERGGVRVDTIFFGGGTPSLVPARHIEAILDSCRRHFRVSADAEVSLEANPGTLQAEKLDTYRSIGINRVSLGAQSFSDEELAVIGRIHTAGEICASVESLRSRGFRNINLDLMLGLPGQTEAGWMHNLECAVSLAPAHISVYMLELDAKVPLRRSVEQGAVKIPDDDLLADWYLLTLDFLDSRGYAQYEISNFARPGCECRHNLKYWRRKPVLAFGVAAHSYDGNVRRANVASLGEYLRAVEAGTPTTDRVDRIDAGRAQEEEFFLGLRLTRGVDWASIRRACSADRAADLDIALVELTDMGLLEWRGDIVRLTRRGMLLSNEVFQRFVELQTN